MTRGYHVFSSITIWRFIWGLKWKLCDSFKCFTLNNTIVSSRHIVRDEWWPAAVAADEQPRHTLPHTRPILN